VPTFADRGVSRGQRNGSPRPLISVYRTWIATYFIQVAPQLTSWGWVYPVPDPLPLRKSGSAGNWTQDLCICSQKLWPLDHRGGLRGYIIVSIFKAATWVMFCSKTRWCKTAFCVLSRNKKNICRVFFGFEFISFPNRGVLSASSCIMKLVQNVNLMRPEIFSGPENTGQKKTIITPVIIQTVQRGNFKLREFN